jgi:hypothetical protein
MKIEDQVCTFEQAKKLKEIGIDQDGYYCYLENSASKIDFGDVNEMFERHIHDYGISAHPEGFDGSFKESSWIAFTCAELGAMLPDYHFVYKKSAGFISMKQNGCHGVADGTVGGIVFKTEAECKANLLIYLLEKKMEDPIVCNERLLM